MGEDGPPRKCHLKKGRGRDLLLRRERKYWVYILANRSRNLYTGITNDIERRVFEHKTGRVPGFAAKYNINRLAYFERHRYVGEAIRREKEIKSWRRSKKVALIESINPTWEDLAADWFSSLAKTKQIPPPPFLAKRAGSE